MVSLLALFVLSLFVTFEAVHWLFGLSVHFTEWYLGFSIVLLVFVLVTNCKNKKIYSTVGGGLVCVFSFHIFMVPLEAERVSGESSEELNVFYANINVNNRDKQKLIKEIRSVNSDLVLLVEINDSWVKELLVLKDIYPYSKIISKSDNFGLAILSKLELINDRVFADRQNQIPSLLVEVKKRETFSLKVVLLHAFPPIGYLGTLSRDQYLNGMSSYLRELKGPVLVCGDLNTTPWSKIYKSFVFKSEISPAVNYFYPNTWPNLSFFPGIPIDHCFSRNLKIANYISGEDIGSDHLPLTMTLMVPPRGIATEN